MPQAPRRRVRSGLIAAVTVLALCLGAWLLRLGTETHGPPQPSAAQAASAHPGTGHEPPGAAPSPPRRPTGYASPRSRWTRRSWDSA